MPLRYVAMIALLLGAVGCREADAAEQPPMVAQRQRPIPRIVDPTPPAGAPSPPPAPVAPSAGPTGVAGPRFDLGPSVGGSHGHGSLGRFSLAPQVAGRPVDGVVLRSIRHAAHRGFHRVVFDFAPGEGTLAAVAPLARAELVRRAGAVEVSLAGVAVDRAAEEGAIVAEGGPRRAGKVFITRAPAHVDPSVEAVAYRVSVPRVHGFALRALEDPPRIVLDIDD